MGAAVTVQRGHGTFLASLHLLVTRKVSFAFTVYPPPPLLSSDPTHTHPPFLFLPYSHRKACVTRAIPPQCCMRQFQLNRRAAKEFPGNKVMKSENKNSKKGKRKEKQKKRKTEGGGVQGSSTHFGWRERVRPCGLRGPQPPKKHNILYY